MTNRKFSQTSPDRANELFAKLLETSDSATRTRERLFSALKEELELLASLQEEHLFPVLRKHEDMAGLVQDAINDNRETSALLEEINRMPKGSGEFLKKVTDLRRVFQQHIRDDKKDLLPAVLKVMSDEEIEAVVEKVEDEMAAVEETRRAEAEERLAASRRSGEPAETAKQTADDMLNTVQAGMEQSQTAMRTMQDAVQGGLGAASELMQLYGMPLRSSQDLAGRTTQNLRALTESSTVLARGLQDVSEEWIGLAQKRLQKNLDGLSTLSQCRNMVELFEAQNALFRNNIAQMLENSRRIVELSSRIANEASRTMASQAEPKTRATCRAA
jgi:hypothetical protein